MEQAVGLISKNSAKKITALLEEILTKEEEEMGLQDLIDKDGFTLLHHATSRNKTRTFEAIMEIAKKRMKQHEIGVWVNL